MTPRITPEERRDQILEAALNCFARTGYQGTSMDAIVAESGLSKGSLYWHFKSKRELFMALFDKIMAEILAPIEPLLNSEGPVTERLRLIGSTTEQIGEQSQELMALPLNFLIEIWQDEAFIQHYMAIIGQFAEQVRALIEEGIASGEFREVDVQAATWGIMALYDGIFLYQMAGIPGDLGRQLATMTDLIIEGLRQRGEG